MTNTYRKLIVWQKSIELIKYLYKETEKYPKAEIFGIVSQMRRAAVSIPSNIAEGSLRGSNKEFLRFLHIAYGSAAELQTQIEIASALHFGSKQSHERLLEMTTEILKMLNKLIGTVSKKCNKKSD